MSQYTTRHCPVCDKEYLADIGRLKHGRQTTCSRECSYKLRAEKSSTSVILSCEFCGKSVEREPAAIKRHTFCSQRCYDAWRIAQHVDTASNDSNEVKALKNRNCIVCNKSFRARTHTSRHCSRKCFEIAHRERMSGKSNPSYIDGRSASQTYDAGAEWHRIRRQIYKRDRYRCQICGVKCVPKRDATDKNSYRIIQCHHKDPYKRSKNNNASNLVTLCLRCHRNVHNGKANV